MPAAIGHYVRAKQQAYPYAERLFSGPFDTLAQATAELDRLRPLYPQYVLTPHTRTAKSLPVARPEPGERRPLAPYEAYDHSHHIETPAGRQFAAECLRGFVENELGLPCMVDEWDTTYDVCCSTPGIRAQIHVRPWPEPHPLPIIRWTPTGAVSRPASWPELFELLEIGLLGSLDGSS